MRFSSLTVQLVGLAACFHCQPASASTGSSGLGFFGVGDLPGGETSSYITGVANGGAVSGTSRSANGTEAFRWSPTDGLEGLGDLPTGFFFSVGRAISADGSTVVGDSEINVDNEQGSEAFRWTQSGGMQGIGYHPPIDPSGPYSFATGVSADGSVIVGETDAPAGSQFRVGFYWTQSTGFQVMSAVSQIPLTLEEFDNVMDVSGDGLVFAGGGSVSFGSGYRAYVARVGQRGELIDLLPGGTVNESSAISGDGLVVVGSGDSSAAGGNNEAFRWSESTGTVGLGFLPGDEGSTADDVNQDGSIIVGRSGNQTNRTTQAFIWDQTNGMRSLESYLTDLGLASQFADWQQVTTAGQRVFISPDGQAIASTGRNADGELEGWVFVVPEPTSLAFIGLGGILLGLTRQRRS